ncbi:MAG: TlpA family protein disulfide reductase, partial [Candidatus Heimdallarchaeota archaeon]
WASAIIIGIILLVSFGLGLWEQKEDLAPEFTLQDINGDVIRLSDFKGQVVLLNFMATWCPECRREMPVLGQAWAKYKDLIILISIDIDPTESDDVLQDFAQTFHYATWIWARDTANLAQVYGVNAIPKTVIINKDGYINFVHTGVISEQTLNSQIERLLG